MSEKPILFSGPMVRAILEDRKTQTRRVIKPQPVCDGKAWACYWLKANREGRFGPSVWGADEVPDKSMLLHCPYGKPGEHLWVRETWAPRDASTLRSRKQSEIFYRADGEFPDDGSWRPSIYMPRWACRLRLDVVTVRVERLQEISKADCIAEGMSGWYQSYARLWDSINAKRGHGWNRNPWVWVVEFRRSK